MSLFASFCVLGGCIAHTQQLVWKVSSAFWGECLWTLSYESSSLVYSTFPLHRYLSLWVGLVTPFLLLLISLSRIRRNSISFGWRDQPVTVISWGWSAGSTLKNRPRASEATAHSSLMVTLGSRPHHSLLLSWSWQPSTAKPHHPVRLKTTMVRLITCCNSQPHRCVRHEIAHQTLVSEVVLLSTRWGRNSVWAPSPHAVLSSHHVFSVYCTVSMTKGPRWAASKEEAFILAHSFSHVSCRVLDPVALELGKRPAQQRRAVHFMAAGKQSGKERLRVLVHPNDITSSNKIPLQNFYPPSAGDQDFSMGILGHM